MNPLLIIVPMSALLAIAGVIRLYGKLANERAKRIEATKKLLEARAERDEWMDTAQSTMLAKASALVTTCKLKREVTKQAEQIDALLNGDRCCVAGHKYYTGQGITCPHCGAEEIVFGPVHWD